MKLLQQQHRFPIDDDRERSVKDEQSMQWARARLM